MAHQPETILIVDDDPKVRMNLALLLEEEGYGCMTAATAEEAWQLLHDPERARPALLLLDIRLDGLSGVDMVRHLTKTEDPPATIVISGEATISETVASLQLGVHDFIEKPFSRQRLLHAVRNCMRHLRLMAEVKRLQRNAQGSTNLLGNSPVMTDLKNQIARVAPTDGRVLILGESGTGKELVAAAIQAQSQRAGQPFVRLNCAALPATLIEDELFGHVRGAFTGAGDHKSGLFEDANHGTLFLDEIGDMEPSLQIKLLRILEDGRVRRLGGKREKQVDVRIIAATNKDLKDRVGRGSFREDLFYRLNSLPIHVPPLRERGEDVLLLTDFYILHFCKKNRIRPKRITRETLGTLRAYPWPGNVRELRNLCERLVILGGDPIQPHHLPSELFESRKLGESSLVRLPPPALGISLRQFKKRSEKEFIESALARTDWDITAAAKLLDIQRTYLHRRIRILGIRKKGEPQP